MSWMVQAALLAASCGAASGAEPDAGCAAADTARPVPVEVEVAHTREVLTGGRGEWTESRVRVARRGSARETAYVEGRVASRFDRGDGDVTVGVVHPLSRSWTATADAAYAPSPVFLPAWSASAALWFAAGGGWVPGYRARYLDFPTPVLVQQAMLEHYRGPYLIGYELTHAAVRSVEGGVAHTARAARYYGDESSVSVAATAGRAVETAAPGEVRLLGLRSASVWGIHWLDGETGLTWVAAWHRSEGSYDRGGLTLGVRRRL